MVIELRVVQFWSQIILVISNRTRAARSFDFEITRMISDQTALHSVQLPLLIVLTTAGTLRNISFTSINEKTCKVAFPSKAITTGIFKAAHKESELLL